MAEKTYDLIKRRVNEEKMDKGMNIFKQAKEIEKTEKLIWLGFDGFGYMVFRGR